MPTYEYRCTSCQHQFEQFQSMKDKPLRKCPQCGKNALERLIGIGAAVLFKGSGFYQTDYRSESYKAAAKAESDAGKPAGDAKPSGDAAASSAAPAAPAAPTASSSQSPPPASASEPKPAAKPDPAKGPSKKKT